MKILIVYNGLCSICPFRRNFMKQSYWRAKSVYYMFTNSPRNTYSVLAPKTSTAKFTVQISKPSVIFVSNYKLFSNLTNSSGFKVQSIWEENGNVENEVKENDVTSNKPERLTLRIEASNQEQHLLRLLEKNRNRADQLINEEWQEIKRTILEMPGNIYDKNIDAYIMNLCSQLKSLALGKSYYRFLKSTNSIINRPTFGSYLRLFYFCAPDCTENDLQEIYSVYKELLEIYPTIDSYTAEKAVAALSITKYWKEYERLFRIIEMSYVPAVNIYCIVISTAFRNKEFDLGWKLINEMKYRGLAIHDDVFVSWFESQEIGNLENAATILLEFFSKFNLKPSLMLCEHLKKVLEEKPSNKRGEWTSMTRRGVCNNCHSNLEKAWVKAEDFDQLKKAFLNPVLIGKDIFCKTRPEEFDGFLKFLENIAPVDVVLDGLNIALNVHKSMRSASLFSFQLKSVVRKFVSEDRKVLVVGKKYMLKWPKKDIQEVFDTAHVFLAEDMSHDDPFLLYATLFSGLGTKFVSRDMMRGHKFLLADPHLQAIFHKWQAQHQYFIRYITNSGFVQLVESIPFMQTIQRNARGDWHIPYVIREELTDKSVIDNFHRHWLCVSSQPARRPASRPGFRPQFSSSEWPKPKGQVHAPDNNQPVNIKKWR